jgi:hypothetical protein
MATLLSQQHEYGMKLKTVKLFAKSYSGGFGLKPIRFRCGGPASG